MSDKVTTGGVSPRADKIFKIIITVLALVMCFIQIGKYISIGGKPIVNMYYLRIYALHYMFGMLFAFLMYDWKGKASGWTGLKKKWPDLILSAAAIAVAVYVMIDPSSFQTRLSITANQNDIIFGALATVVTIAAAYKLSGKALPIMAVIFIGYAFLGKYISGGFGHRGYSLQRVIVNIFGDQGIWGSALATSCNIIFLFILFGAFLEVSGANEIFRDLSISLAGAKRGGPAKIAVISSAIMGTISGSAIANVVTTGAFTIPLMKKQKYRDEFAGAVEAVSSTGGQLMPPVMGAAAFLMAEATAIPYGTICLAALVPALMYYICIFSTVDVESLKANLTGMDLKDIPKLLPVLKKSAKLLLPIAVLILSLCVFGFSTSRSALYSMAVLIICCCFDKDDRFSLKKLVNALRSGAIGSTTVITATAICGIIISMLTMTGLGVKFSSLLISLGSSSLLISLLLAMLVCIVLGMGLPTAAAYIIASSTIATALIKLGVPVLGAHMFLFYFSSIACITPPVALASYAAAGICKAPPMKVSMEAVKIGIVAFLVPYAFIYNPSILTYDFSSPYMILDTIVTFVCCVVDALPISYVVQGYHYRPIRLYERALFLAIAIGLIWPGVVVPLISLAVFLLFWLPARAKYYKENPKLPTPAAN